ncbi:hypothetical protein CCACVL1_06762, partial [Corchorus capsularis]
VGDLVQIVIRFFSAALPPEFGG